MENEKSRSGRIAYALALSVSCLASVAGFYYQFIYRPEQVRRLYVQAGLSDEQARAFVLKFYRQNGNSTWISFAKAWAENKALAEKSYDVFRSLEDALNYVSKGDGELLLKALDLYGRDADRFVDFVNLNGYDGLGFLKDFPQFKDSYGVVLPAYSMNASVVKAIHDQIQRDGRVNISRNSLFIEALKNYDELNILKKNVLLPTIYAVNNLTIAYL